MSVRPIDDCEACRDALTELVCDELDADTRAAVMRHIEGCTSCAMELSRFRSVMQVAEAVPLEAPSQRVHDAVMLAAREAQARRAAQAQAKRDAAPGLLAKLRAWLASAGTWAMSPQVAMASVLLLMLGVGLMALPLGEDREPVALRAAEEPEAAEPTSASAATVPVMPAAPAMPMPAAEPFPEQPAAPAEVLEAARAADKAESASRAAMPRSATSSRRERDAKAAAIPDRKGSGASLDDGLLDSAGDGRAQDQSAPAPKPSEAKKSADAYRSGGGAPFPGSLGTTRSPRGAASNAVEGFAEAPPPSPAAQASSPMQVTAAEESEASPESQLLAQGIRAAQNGDHAGAIAVLKPLAEKASPSIRRDASLWLARSYRALDDCKSALRYYAPMTASQSASPSVLVEAADCYQRTGELKQASVLRSRAQPAKARTSKPAADAY